MFVPKARLHARSLLLLAGFALSLSCDKSSGPAAAQPEDPGMAQAAPAPANSAAPAQTPASEAAGQPISAPVPAEQGEGLADGSPCQRNADCQSGICEGQGCGDDAAATCMSKERPCTYDLVPYCGCDGSTFQSSSVCPGQRYASQGACPGEGAQ